MEYQILFMGEISKSKLRDNFGIYSPKRIFIFLSWIQKILLKLKYFNGILLQMHIPSVLHLHSNILYLKCDDNYNVFVTQHYYKYSAICNTMSFFLGYKS